MNKEKLGIRLSFGATILSFILFLIVYEGNITVNRLMTIDLFNYATWSFGIGFLLGLILRLGFKLRTDLNLTSLFIPIFFTLIYFIVGNTHLTDLFLLDLIFYAILAGFLSIFIGLIRFVL